MARQVSSAQLTKIRTRNQAALMPDTCDIYDPPVGQTRTAGGGFTPNVFPTNWVKTSSIPCRLSPNKLRPEEKALAGAMTGAVFFNLTLPQGQVITSKSRVIVTSLDNRVFQVKAVLNGSWDVDTLAQVEEVTS